MDMEVVDSIHQTCMQLSPLTIYILMGRRALQNEKWLSPLGGRDITGQYDPRVHGYNGNTLVSLVQSEPTEFDRLFMQSAQQLNGEFPFNLDPNSGNPIGVSKSTLCRASRRSS